MVISSSVDGVVDQNMIDSTRLSEPPDTRLVHTVISIDPADTYGNGGDETGIIVVARGADDRGYVLTDLSCKASPDGWARIVAMAYDHYTADSVIAEKNQFGDMVHHIVQSVSPGIAYKGIVASVPRKIRAQPVIALYEQSKVSHVGYFEALEREWVEWVSDLSIRQPRGRVNALVQGLSEIRLWS